MLPSPVFKVVPEVRIPRKIDCPICRDYGVVELQGADREHCINSLVAAILAGEATLCLCGQGGMWLALLDNQPEALARIPSRESYAPTNWGA